MNMFEEVMDVIKKAGIFMVLAQTLLHLCMGNSYEKYIKMIVGFITAFMLLVPVIEALDQNKLKNFEEYCAEYERELFGKDADFEKIRDEAWGGYFSYETKVE